MSDELDFAGASALLIALIIAVVYVAFTTSSWMVNRIEAKHLARLRKLPKPLIRTHRL